MLAGLSPSETSLLGAKRFLAVSWRGLFSALTDLCCLCSNLLFL